MRAKTHENASENSSTIPMPPRKAPQPAWMRKPTAKPTATMRITVKTLRTRSAAVRPANCAARDIGRDRKRSVIPLWRSCDNPTAVFMAPNTTVCTKTPGHEEVDVGHAGQALDGPAEHVAERQHEDDRLDRAEDDDLRRPQHRAQVPPGDGRGVGHRPAEEGTVRGRGRTRPAPGAATAVMRTPPGRPGTGRGHGVRRSGRRRACERRGHRWGRRVRSARRAPRGGRSA